MTVEISVSGQDLVIVAPELLRDRMARLFFRGVLGGTQTDNGWIVSTRKSGVESATLRVAAFLAKRGIDADFGGAADLAVQRDLERRRSFERTREAATALRSGTSELTESALSDSLAAVGWNLDARTLRPHQVEGVAHALTAINAANFSVPGSGKTATALAVAAQHLAADTIQIVVVVGPLSSFRPWESETRIALGTTLSPRRIRGSRSDRRALYRQVKPRDLLLLSYATAAHDCDRLLELFDQFNAMLVVDESHRVKRFRGGFWAPALMELSERARVRMVLSGTPMPQSGKDLYSQMKILWPGGELTGPREEFGRRAERQFSAVLSTIQPFVFRTPKEALGLPPYQVTRVGARLVGIQAEVYELVESGFRRLAGAAGAWKDKVERLRRARPVRLLQAATNPALLNHRDSAFSLERFDPANASVMSRLASYESLEVPSKTAAGLAVVQEIAADGGKVVCWSNFIANLDDFCGRVKDEIRIPCYQVDGRVPAGDSSEDDVSTRNAPDSETDTRERIISRFLATEGPAVLVANPASCSESISLHSTCRNAVYLDRTYDCALFLQSVDRIHRLGLPPDANVRVWILEATIAGRTTIDELVDRSLARKEARMRELLEGAELRPLQLGDAPHADADGDDRDLQDLIRYLLGEDD